MLAGAVCCQSSRCRHILVFVTAVLLLDRSAAASTQELPSRHSCSTAIVHGQNSSFPIALLHAEATGEAEAAGAAEPEAAGSATAEPEAAGAAAESEAASAGAAA